MASVLRTPASLRFALLTATAVWLAVVGSGASMLHSHDGESPHRHLILLGIECPAELPADGDGPGDSHATAGQTHDTDEPTGSEVVVFLALPQSEPRATPNPIPHDAPAAPPESIPSARATRSAILRA